MLPDWTKEPLSLLAIIVSLITLITLLVKFVIKQYNDRQKDAATLKGENALMIANERVKTAEEAVAQTDEIYQKFMEDYKDFANKFLENSKQMISAVEGNKQAISSMEKAIAEGSKINEKLSVSVDKLRDSITDNLLKIAK